MTQNIPRDRIMAFIPKVREMIRYKNYSECENLIASYMTEYPHAPEPHNLMGVLLESMGDHPAGMKHFRAAWSLDPTYLPARHNLEHFSTFFSKRNCAYDESDCRTIS